jgi:hypothetical protein
VTIIRQLEGTAYWEEAINVLSDELAGDDAKALLRAWVGEGAARQTFEDLRRVVGEL